MMDDQTFLHLYTMYHARIYRRIYKRVKERELAQDIAQDTWLKVWLHPPQQQNIAGWIGIVADHTAIDALRRRAVLMRHQVDIGWEDLEELLWEEQSSPLEMSELSEQSTYAFSRLKSKYRQVLLFSLHGLTIEEMGKRTGLSSYAIKTRLARARSQFKRHLSQEHEER